MSTINPPSGGIIVDGLRVLIVDDNRDGADAMGWLIEELGHEVHVTYGGAEALEVATVFRPDLMLIDLVMPEMDGYELVQGIRQISTFAHTKLVALTGQRDPEYQALAMKAGFDHLLFKPAALTEIKAVLASVVVSEAAPAPKPIKALASLGDERRLPIEKARRIRNQRASKALTQAECEAAVCDGIMRFQEEFLGWHSEEIQAHLIKDLLVVRIRGVLTLAERQLAESSSPDRGREHIKQGRKQLLELARPMLVSLIHEVIGVKVVSMHHDLSTVTGEEVIVFSFSGTPHFA